IAAPVATVARRRAGVGAVVCAAAALLPAVGLLPLLAAVVALLALLPLLALLALLSLLPALLAVLRLLALPLALLRAIAHALIERFHAAHEIARLVGGARERILLRLAADGRGSVADLLLQRVEVRADVVLHAARVSAALLNDALRVADLLADALVADAAGGLIELARRLLLVAPHLVRELLE